MDKTIKYKIEEKKVHKDNIYPNPLNEPFIKSVDRAQIEKIKESIMKLGLVHELIVIEDELVHGSFRLLAGEKRLMAISSLDKEIYDRIFPNGIPCRVIRPEKLLTSKDEKKLFIKFNMDRIDSIRKIYHL